MRLTVTLLATFALAGAAVYAYLGLNGDSGAPAVEHTALGLPGSPDFTRTGAAPLIDFSGVQVQLGGEPTRVLVLGTTHLNALPEDAFSPDHLDLVIDRLTDWAPQIIAIEAVGGRTCDVLRRYGDLYPGVADTYCYDPAPALETLQMDQPTAALAVLTTLSEWPEHPGANDRRQLAAQFFGAGEPWSAALQWSRLDSDDRIAADGVSEALRAQLDRLLTSRNENNLLALRLARALGLERLAAMDDHSADIIQVLAPPELGPAIQSVWQADHPRDAEMAEAEDGYMGSPEAVLDGYRFLNSEPYQRYVIEGDFGRAAATPDADAVARQYVAWWQVRGLRMAANVVEAAGNRPGARVLVIVGASHKAYFDAYLDQMHDIELVDVQAVLADPEISEDAP